MSFGYFPYWRCSQQTIKRTITLFFRRTCFFSLCEDEMTRRKQSQRSSNRSASNGVRQNTLLMLYSSFVRSHLLYGILTWGSTNNIVLHPLQVLQNKIVRIISNVKKNERITNNSLYKH